MSDSIPKVHERINALDKTFEKAQEMDGKHIERALENFVLHKIPLDEEQYASLLNIEDDLRPPSSSNSPKKSTWFVCLQFI